MTTKKKTKTKTKTTKTARRVSRSKMPGIKAPPKTIFAAIDPQGTLRFSSASMGPIDVFVAGIGSYYRVAQYNFGEIKSVSKKKPVVKKRPVAKKKPKKKPARKKAPRKKGKSK